MKVLAGKSVAFVILLFVLISSNCMTEEERIQYKERQKVVEALNAQFDLSDPTRELGGMRVFDCRFKFRIDDSKNKVLIASFCESTSGALKKGQMDGFMTPGNFALIKNAGFQEVRLYTCLLYTSDAADE